MKNTSIMSVFAAAALGGFCLLIAQAAPTLDPVDDVLPPVWKNVSATVRNEVAKVAQLDGLRALAEHIYGIDLTSSTCIYDLLLRSDEIAGRVENIIIRGVDHEAPEYLADGTVRVKSKVKVREVLEEITKTVSTVDRDGKTVSRKELESVVRNTRDILLDEYGYGAPAESNGLRLIQARRAARMDAYRNLAARLLGVQITSSTTVRNFALESDSIQARLAQMLKGAYPTKEQYDRSTLNCSVTLEMKVADIYEIISYYAKNKPKKSELLIRETERDIRTYSATGKGAPRAEGAKASASELPPKDTREAVTGAFTETKVIVRRLLGREVGVLD